ncbi:DUF952 domain-containing protein [Amphritea balenae]|uniref:DUF952 domain-containing protein n=1 Tax=Amphritea balenae TaxID=452629 RepID=A0A3P1ST48_9GAMM|nr:DUF952 domain-containing protein [Amphritea balenae]RRC99352.1 DUF952 domain-containing protein [Amphritea balenae]GGK71835.1 hypothetical protein GCM10007941_22280 [Amphritea balenae]
MSSLYRVITEEAWIAAQKTQTIPRCGNDNKADRIHLNVIEAVESVAAAYFEPEERPLVLEIDVSGFTEHIEWTEPAAQEVWRQPLVNIPSLPFNAVVKVHQLEHSLINGKNVYTLGK